MAEPDFPIVQVAESDRDQDELMGTKQKFWFHRPDAVSKQRTKTPWLFKYSQEGTGQHWAEKIACELASALSLPHAQVELAVQGGQLGCIVRTVLRFLASDKLDHGNEVLYAHDPTYPKLKPSPADHTVERVLNTLVIADVAPPRQTGADADADVQELSHGADWFVGYLLLDALIGNTDRHHENWAVIQTSSANRESRPLTLAPTFDHGSSLGRELRDNERERRLKEGWATGGVVYANRCRSGLCQSPNDKRRVHPIKAYRIAACLRPQAGQVFSERLRRLDESMIDAIVRRVPARAMSELAKSFSTLLLRHNRASILGGL